MVKVVVVVDVAVAVPEAVEGVVAAVLVSVV